MAVVAANLTGAPIAKAERIQAYMYVAEVGVAVGPRKNLGRLWEGIRVHRLNGGSAGCHLRFRRAAARQKRRGSRDGSRREELAPRQLHPTVRQ
jgi:hypothetical protein